MKRGEDRRSGMNLAGNVQQLLLPKSSPVCDWCCVGIRNRMADTVGGDYFDFVTTPNGCQAIFLGDVTGHGAHASLIMSLLYGYLHRLAEQECDPQLTVTRLNTFLQRFAQRSIEYDHYFSSTLFYSVIHPGSLTMHYVNAGHVAPLVCRAGEIYRLGATAAPVGFFESTEMCVGTFQFQRDDRFLLYTDGVTELQNPQGEFFGVDRLESLLKKNDDDYLSFLQGLFAQLERFAEEHAAEDDCTAIVVDFHAGAPAFDV